MHGIRIVRHIKGNLETVFKAEPKQSSLFLYSTDPTTGLFFQLFDKVKIVSHLALQVSHWILVISHW
jgi:hypothetical protein